MQYDDKAARNKFPSNEYAEYAAESHYGPEWRQSGALPQQPRGLEVEATYENHTPFKNMRNGR